MRGFYKVIPDKHIPGNSIPIFLYPGTVFVSKGAHEVFTVLGSCVSVCLWDKELKIGSINHFLLPSKHNEASDSPKFGDFATELLLKKMLELGSCKEKLWAKVFGGANQLNNSGLGYQVGQLNVEMLLRS